LIFQKRTKKSLSRAIIHLLGEIKFPPNGDHKPPEMNIGTGERKYMPEERLILRKSK
jgi:hypothetical protein